MKRQIVEIDGRKCNGCGLCADACHEGAIGMVDGKAVLLRDDYCDGLGNCLPVCPTGAITFIEREAAPYVEKAEGSTAANAGADTIASTTADSVSELRQWPAQIKLVPVNAPFFNGADLLVAADCTAYARAGFHAEFMRGKVTLIGCPKLDEGDYSEKLTAILNANELKSVTVVRLEVPCCGGIENAVKTALKNCGKMIPWQVVTISTDGKILEN